MVLRRNLPGNCWVAEPVRQREWEARGRRLEGANQAIFISATWRPRDARVDADHFPRAQLRHGHGRTQAVALVVKVLGLAAEISFPVVRTLLVATRSRLVRVLGCVALVNPRVDQRAIFLADEHGVREVAGRILDVREVGGGAFRRREGRACGRTC